MLKFARAAGAAVGSAIRDPESGRDAVPSSGSGQPPRPVDGTLVGQSVVPSIPVTGGYRFARIKILQLSCWHNIFGPTVVHVWVGKGDRGNDVYIARHTLNGEECHASAPAPATDRVRGKQTPVPEHGSSLQLEFKFHMFTEIGYSAASALFTAHPSGKPTRYALTVAFDLETLPAFTRVHNCVEELLSRLSRRIERLIAQRVSTKEMIETVLGLVRKYGTGIDRLLTIVYVNLGGLPPGIGRTDDFIRDSNVHDPGLSPVMSRPASSPVSSPRAISTRFRSPCEVSDKPLLNDETRSLHRFLHRAVTSHLQTQQCSVVVGRDVRWVEEFTRMFAVVLSPRDRALYCPFVETYVPNLRLQGICRTSYPEWRLEEVLLHSRVPSTVIDLDAETVAQTVFSDFLEIRDPFLDNQFGIGDAAVTGHLLQKVEQKHVAPLVSKMMDSAATLPPRLINCYLAGRPLDKRMRQLLGIENKQDYAIFLATAERVYPGYYMKMEAPAILFSRLESMMFHG